MAEIITAKIVVQQTAPNRAVLWFSHFTFWTLLVGSIAVTRFWFGGSFVLEFFAVIMALFIAVKIAQRSTGQEVTMTPAELRRWIAAGAPKNVVEWREEQKAL